MKRALRASSAGAEEERRVQPFVEVPMSGPIDAEPHRHGLILLGIRAAGGTGTRNARSMDCSACYLSAHVFPEPSGDPNAVQGSERSERHA